VYLLALPLGYSSRVGGGGEWGQPLLVAQPLTLLALPLGFSARAGGGVAGATPDP